MHISVMSDMRMYEKEYVWSNQWCDAPSPVSPRPLLSHRHARGPYAATPPQGVLGEAGSRLPGERARGELPPDLTHSGPRNRFSKDRVEVFLKSAPCASP